MMVMKSLLLQIGVLLFFVDGCLSIPEIKPETSVYVNESVPIGHVFGPFYVEDRYSSGPFQISLKDSPDNFLNLTTDGINFTLILNKELDYDRVPDNDPLLKYVQILVGKVKIQITFQILDVNDESPEFENLPYTVSIDENSSPQLIKTVSAIDWDIADKNNLIYTLEAQAKNSESLSKFKMNNTRDGKIYLTGSLDYEQVKFYHYFVIAHDTVGHETTANLYITVNDLQDSAPYFTGTPYRGHVDENTPVGSSTKIKIMAFDGDTGMPNPVNYSIINDTCNNSFSIDSTSGLILVQKHLDTDSKMLIDNTGQCKLTVKAQEICNTSTATPQNSSKCLPTNSSTTTVTITVNDLNDNSPVFNFSSYNGTIKENSPQGIPVNFTNKIHVSDKDQGDNSMFDLSIEPDDIFEIVPRTVRSSASVSIRVKKETALDYEKNQTFILKMKAIETKTKENHTTTATVTINLININDNEPVFQNDSYEIHLLENIVPGTRVINVTATDGDRGTFGEITYSFQTPVVGFNITTANNIGQIILTEPLNRETRSTYYLAVVAEDGGGLKSRSQLIITVEDVNDNPPKFLQTSYAANIKETSKQFSPSLTVSATDADIRQNGNITYSIKSAFPQNVRANFSIDAFTGNISVNQGLDYESLNDTKGQITLNVTASDQGSPQLTATVTVSITVQDENDNSPKFDKNPFFAEVKENATSGSVVVRVKATDHDGSPPNNAVFYSILNGDFGKFRINSNTGDITCAGSLDTEQTSTYSIKVNAQDRGNPPRSTNTTVVINVTNINDEKPTFGKDIYETSVYENKNNSVIFNLFANDTDADSNLEYYIIWSESSAFDARGHSGQADSFKNWFDIDTSSGNISTRSGVDREQVERINLVIMVNDTNGVDNLPQTASCTLSITVKDENDNPPVFTNGPNYTAEVRENMQPGIPLSLKTPTSMLISDKDKGNNSKFTLEIEPYADYFEPDPKKIDTTGSVVLKIKNQTILDYEKYQSLTFHVIAKELDGIQNQHSSTATVNLRIIDVNDNDPKFSSISYSKTIPEMNTTQPKHVIQIQATDKDSNEFGHVTYSLQGGEGLFTINHTSGEVMINGSVDYETKQTYYLTIVAADGGGRRQTAPLTINISDVNDNAPQFLRTDYQGFVKENSTTFDNELKIKAVDKDKKNTPNSQITYKLLHAVPSNLKSHFNVNSSNGVLSLIHAVDYENISETFHGQILLTLQGCDHGNRSLCSEVNAIITVQDINDFTPKFTKAEYRASVPENIIANGNVTMVSASDGDGSAPNNATVYIIKSGGGDKFRINSATGLITRAGELDRESVQNYSLIVQAMDLGTPSRTGTTTVFINVTNVNDESPFFPNPNLQISLLENVSANSIVYNFTAHDGDQDASLNYTIDWKNVHGVDNEGIPVTNSVLKTTFKIDGSTGGIIALSDIEKVHLGQIILPVHVVDMNAVNTSVQTASGTLTINIEDVNDNTPTFSNSTVKATIIENTQPGIPVVFSTGELKVFDHDKGVNSRFRLDLLDHNTTFEPVPKIVQTEASVLLRVTHSSELDYETVKHMTIHVVATETDTNEHRSSTCTIELAIEDANDNAPEFFTNTSYVASVPENQTNFNVLKVMATDRDSHKYGMGKYVLQETDAFMINESSGEIFTIKPLDAEKQSVYELNVNAVDRGNRSTSVQITVKIIDVNDEIPIFRRDQYYGIIKENQENFIRELQVQAVDNDVDPPNNQFNFSFIPSSSGLENNFTLDPKSGVIEPKTKIDYEKLPHKLNGIIQLQIKAEDGGSSSLSSITNLTITVEDENDESPVFNTSIYYTSVHEGINSGTSVTTVTAHDHDGTPENSDLLYELSGPGSDKFRINSQTGEMKTAGELDYERNSSYTLTVTAKDRGALNDSTTVHINITDVNDELPVFANDSVTVKVKENSKHGAVVSTVSATDPDTHPSLKYRIVWVSSTAVDNQLKHVNISKLKPVFGIHASNGTVFINGTLDREEVKTVTLKVMVTDENGASPQTALSTLLIEVTDENDNPPVFNYPNLTYVAQVKENSRGIPVTFVNISTMTITDADQDRNAAFNISVSSDMFKAEPSSSQSKTTVQILVSDSAILDYETNKSFNLTVTAFDGKWKNNVTLIVNVIDVNDNSPKFNKTQYTAKVFENSTNFKEHPQIQAVDKDNDYNVLISYSLQGGLDIFSINNESGVLTINEPSKLDWETRRTYTMTLIASDGERQDSAPLTIEVLDINDNAPTFIDNEYKGICNEGSMNFSRIIKVQARDDDKPDTNNSKIVYSIRNNANALSNHFTINSSTGEIQIKTPLDYEQMDKSSKGFVLLEVEAKDLGTPSLSSVVNVTIVVQDVNDNEPNFTQHQYSGSIFENATEGTFVSEILASDSDGTSPNNDVFYFIHSGGSDKFRVDSKNGTVSVQAGATLDRETKANYTLVVNAMDKGSPPQTATATLMVTVIDVNDELPEFESVRQSIEVHEDKPVNSSLIMFDATDKDENSDLLYQFLWNQSFAVDEKGQKVDINEVKSWLDINVTSGEILINSTLDRETAKKLIIEILVEDLNAVVHRPQTATGTLTVNILDVNDNDPHFTQGSVIPLAVSESTPVGTDLITITADDKDENRTITFSLVDTTTFNITKKGRLFLARKLDRETKDRYNVTVIAEDNGYPSRNSSATINITVLDANDNDPVFNMTTTTFYIPENATNNTLVATVNATDADIGLNGNITFLNENGWGGGPFRIDEDVVNDYFQHLFQADIYLTRTLDREKKDLYSFEITAHDNPSREERRKSKIVITVKVTDINDETPVFGEPRYNAKIPEDKPVNESITVYPGQIISATDKDIEINGKIKYSFLHTNVTNLFRIDENTGEVFVNQSLLGKAGNYSLTVIATDQGEGHKHANVTLDIDVRDKNLNHPKFVLPFNLSSVPECAKVGTPVYRFKATDADKDKSTNGKVMFRLINSTTTDFKYLQLNSESGELKINRPLDRENKSFLLFQVEVYDLGIPRLSNQSKVLKLEIRDVNDNPPVFDNIPSKQKSLTVEENVKNMTIGTIKAHDPDSNAHMCYSMSGSNWTSSLRIHSPDNTTAQIFIINPLDREIINRFDFNLTVKDCSAIPKEEACDSKIFKNFKPDQITVTIIVEDVNDNPPRFTKSKISAGIRQKVEVGKIIFELQKFVQDEDIGKNRVHRFTMPQQMMPDPQLKKTFDVAKYKEPILLTANGTLKTNMKFGEDMVGFLHSVVYVADSAGNDSTQVKVYIIADYQVLKLTFNQAPDDLNKLKNNITQTLQKATGWDFIVNDEVSSSKDKDGNVKKFQSNLFVHAVDPKTEHIFDASVIREQIDFHPSLTRDLIRKFNLYQVKEDAQEASPVNNSERLQYILGGVIGFLILVVCLVAFFFFNSMRKFKRKLKAATTEVYAMDPKKPLANGVFESGFSENPLFNKEVGENDFEDSVSITSKNSLDANQVGEPGNTVDEQEVTMTLSNDDNAVDANHDADTFLNMALQHHDKMNTMSTRGHPSESYLAESFSNYECSDI